jgi:hypothetical protein
MSCSASVNLVLQLALVDVGIDLNDLGDDIGTGHGRGTFTRSPRAA